MTQNTGGEKPQGQQGQKPSGPKLTLSVDPQTPRDAQKVQVRFKRNWTVSLRVGTADMPYDQKLPITITTGVDGIGDCKLDLSGFDERYDRLTAFAGDITSNTVTLPGYLTAMITGSKSSSHLKVKPQSEVIESNGKSFSVQITTLTKGKPGPRRLRIEIDEASTFGNMVTGLVLAVDVRMFFVDSDHNGQVSLVISYPGLETNLRIVDQETGQTVEKTLRFI